MPWLPMKLVNFSSFLDFRFFYKVVSWMSIPLYLVIPVLKATLAKGHLSNPRTELFGGRWYKQVVLK